LIQRAGVEERGGGSGKWLPEKGNFEPKEEIFILPLGGDSSSKGALIADPEGICEVPKGYQGGELFPCLGFTGGIYRGFQKPAKVVRGPSPSFSVLGPSIGPGYGKSKVLHRGEVLFQEVGQGSLGGLRPGENFWGTLETYGGEPYMRPIAGVRSNKSSSAWKVASKGLHGGSIRGGRPASQHTWVVQALGGAPLLKGGLPPCGYSD